MSQGGSGLQAHAELDRDRFFEAIRLLRRHAKPYKAAKASIWRDGEDLVVGLGGGEVRTPMTGRWEGQARLNGQVLIQASKRWPTKPPFSIRVESGRLVFSGFSIPCEWESTSSPRVLIPVGASLVDILIAGARHSDEDLERAGYLDAVRDARKRRERIVREAGRLLEPLKVGEEDVERIVMERFRSLLSRSADGS